MNPNTNDQTPQNLRDTPPLQATKTETPSVRKIIQPISENLVVDSDPREQVHTNPQNTAAAQPVTASDIQPSGPPPKYPQYGAAHQTYGQSTTQAQAEKTASGGLITAAVTIIGGFYAIGGVLLVLSGFMGILAMNPLAVIVPWATGALYIYLGKGLIQRDSTARSITLVLAWLIMVGSVFGTITTAFMLLPTMSQGIGMLKLLVLAPLLTIFILELLVVIILSNKRTKQLFS